MNRAAHLQYFLLGFVTTLVISLWVSFSPAIFNTGSSYYPIPLNSAVRATDIFNIITSLNRSTIVFVRNITETASYQYYALGLGCRDILDCQESIKRIKSLGEKKTSTYYGLASNMVDFQRSLVSSTVAKPTIFAASSGLNRGVLGASTSRSEGTYSVIPNNAYEGAYRYLDNISFGALTIINDYE